MNNLCDAAAERAVLAGVCTYGADGYADVADLVTAKSFSVDSNQSVWACLEYVFKENPKAQVDLPTLLSAAQAVGLGGTFDPPAERDHLRAVMNMAVKKENVRPLAFQVRKLEFARHALDVVDAVRDDLLTVTGTEPIEAILSRVENPILDISSLLTGSGQGPRSMGDGVRDYVGHLAANQRDVVGIPSGFRKYDQAIGGGFRPGTVNCVGARPKVGKTLLAMNVGMRVASGAGYDWPKFDPGSQVPVLYLDTEMTREDQWTRMLSLLSGVKIDDIETGRYAKDPYKRRLVSDAVSKLESIPYDFLSVAGQPFEETEAVMRRWVTRRVGTHDDGSAKPCLIIFDYLKLMSSEAMEAAKLAEFQVLGFMMTRLHNFAVKYKVPLLAFVQLNRDGINVEDTSAVSQSDRIIWLCSNFSIYKKKSDEELAEQAGCPEVYNRKLVPVVARHGAGLDDGDYINVMSHGAIAKIVEGPTRGEASRQGGQVAPAKGELVGDTSDQDEISFAA
jgi:replicative DNA helicase